MKQPNLFESITSGVGVCIKDDDMSIWFHMRYTALKNPFFVMKSALLPPKI